MALRISHTMALSVLVLSAACSKPTPEAMMRDARAALAAKNFRTAEIHLKNLLQQTPTDVDARELLGQVQLSAGDGAGAEQSFRRAMELGADPGRVRPSLLRAEIAQGRFDEVISDIASNPMPAAGPERAALLRLQGVAQSGRGDFKAAEESFRGALALEPDSREVRTELAGALLAQKRTDDARALVDEVLAASPTFPDALLLRGRLEMTAGQVTAAVTTFRQLVDQERASGVQSQVYAKALPQLVEAELAAGDVDAASKSADAYLALNARNPLARYAKAVVEVREKKLDGAEARLQGVIADVPTFAPAQRLLGEIKLQQNQPDQAVMYLRSAVANDATDGVARQQLAQLYIRQGDVDAARKLVDNSDVDDSVFLAFAGRASAQAGLQQQAEDLFQQSEEHPPENARDLVSVTGLYVAAGEFDRAVRVLQSIRGDAQKAMLADYLTALILLRQGNLRDAEAAAERLQQKQATAAWPLDLRGAIALAGNDLAGARALHERALKIEPRDVTALLSLGRIAARTGETVVAEGYLRQALALDPKQPVALLGLAEAAVKRKDLPAARGFVEKMPESVARLRADAQLSVMEGHFDQAATAFARLFEVQPSEDVALRAYDAAQRAGRPRPETQLLAWSANHPSDIRTNFALGSLALGNRDNAEAIRRFEAVVARNPTHAAALNNLAWLYGEAADARAIPYGERAEKADPKNPAILDTLGWLYLKNGDAAKALPLLEKAVEGLNEQPEVRYHWAVALAETGATDRARETFQRLVDGGSFPSRADAERRLRDLQVRH